MIVEFLVGQLLFIIFNIINSHVDAYRILKDKRIAHGINFAAYIVFDILLCWVFQLELKVWKIWKIYIPHGQCTQFILISFFNRQIFFDTSLNLRRGLEWYYQSKAEPPKSITDQIERFIFGRGEYVGKLIFCFYLGCYVATSILFILNHG